MKLKNLFSIFILITVFSIISVNAATVDTVLIKSTRMDTSFKAVIVLPDKYNETEDKNFPVVYLLHGWSGDYSNWAQKTDLGNLVDKYNFIIVCPDGGFAGWYLDSPLKSDSQYESYIANEVVENIDKNYRTILKPEGWFICGLSMGGHGAISLLAKHPDSFAAAGSISGVMELTGSTKKYGIVQLIGDYNSNQKLWDENSCVNLIDKLAGLNKGIIIDCGVDDRFIGGNRKIHQKMMELKIEHVYIERPGGHSWDYWTNALEYHLLFFHKFLNAR